MCQPLPAPISGSLRFLRTPAVICGAMATTRDGIQTPYPPSPTGIGLGVLVTAAGVAALVGMPGTPSLWCAALPATIVGILMVVNQFKGISRVRVTHSKLLVEDERLVMGFLVGPAKRRVAWKEYAGAEVVDGEVVVKDDKGGALKVGQGVPQAELEELLRRIVEAEKNFREEGG